jgi:hypothetical protein
MNIYDRKLPYVMNVMSIVIDPVELFETNRGYACARRGGEAV